MLEPYVLSTIAIGALPFLKPGIVKYLAVFTYTFFIASSNFAASISKLNLTSFLFSVFSTFTLISFNPFKIISLFIISQK